TVAQLVEAVALPGVFARRVLDRFAMLVERGPQVGAVVVVEACLEHRAQRAQLALACETRALGVGVAIPRPGEARQARAPAATVRREHRTHPTLVVRV